jgi:hypothetical protein
LNSSSYITIWGLAIFASAACLRAET